MGKRQLAAFVGAYEVSTANMWATDAKPLGRDPRTAFLALRHWSRLAAGVFELFETIDDVCGAIASLDRAAVEWHLIDSTPGTARSLYSSTSRGRTQLLAAIVRQVGLPTQSLCD